MKRKTNKERIEQHWWQKDSYSIEVNWIKFPCIEVVAIVPLARMLQLLGVRRYACTSTSHQMRCRAFSII